jgi:hypothetical protein
MWAETLPAREPPATNEEFAKIFEYIAVMPSRNDDNETGRKRLAAYRTMLSEYSNNALAFMARRVFSEHTFFPSVKQCLEALSQYREPLSKRAKVINLCQLSAEDRFGQFIAALRDDQTQDWIDSHPLHWRRMAVERGLLRWDNGVMVKRLVV